MTEKELLDSYPILDDKDFTLTRNSIIKLLGKDKLEDDRGFMIDLFDTYADQDGDDFFYDMLRCTKFILEGATAYTTSDHIISLNYPCTDIVPQDKERFQRWYFVYCHECLHQLWDTFEVAKEIQDAGLEYDHELLNIASDCVINDYLTYINKSHKIPIIAGITNEYIEKEFGVKYDRKYDTQYSLYVKLLKLTSEQKDKLKDKFGDDEDQQNQNSSSNGGSQQDKQKKAQDAQDAADEAQKAADEAQKAADDAKKAAKKGDAKQTKAATQDAADATKKAADATKDFASKESKDASDAADKANDSAEKSDLNDMAKKAQEAADKAKEAAKAAQEAADKAKEEAEQQGQGGQSKDGQRKDGQGKNGQGQGQGKDGQGKGGKNGQGQGQDKDGKGKDGKNGQGQGSQGKDGKEDKGNGKEKGDGAGDIDERAVIEEIKRHAEATCKKYQNSIVGSLKDFTNKCKISKKLKSNGLMMESPKGSTNWTKTLTLTCKQFVKQKLHTKKEYKSTYNRIRRGERAFTADDMKNHRIIMQGREEIKSKVGFDIACYTDTSSSMSNCIDSVFSAIYGICEQLKREFGKEKIVDKTKINLKSYIFTTQMREIKFGQKVGANGGTYEFGELLEDVYKKEASAFLNIIITDGEFGSINTKKVVDTINKMEGLFVMVTNNREGTFENLVKAVKSKCGPKLQVIYADANFSIK